MGFAKTRPYASRAIVYKGTQLSGDRALKPSLPRCALEGPSAPNLREVVTWVSNGTMCKQMSVEGRWSAKIRMKEMGSSEERCVPRKKEREMERSALGSESHFVPVPTIPSSNPCPRLR